MRIFKHRSFYGWAKSEGMTDITLKKAITEMEKGLHDGSLGSGLYKKRVPAPGKGKRGSYRTLVAFKNDDKAFFIYGFAKNDLANIDTKEEKIFRHLAKDFLNMDDSFIDKLINAGKLFEVK